MIKSTFATFLALVCLGTSTFVLGYKQQSGKQCLYRMRGNRDCTVRLLDSGISFQLKNDLLRQHNQFRQQAAQGKLNGMPQAANMDEMVWNIDLEETADATAKACSCSTSSDGNTLTKHSMNYYCDEMDDPKQPVEVGFKAAMKSWFRQAGLFPQGKLFTVDIPSKSTVAAQMLNAKTNQIGCSFARCYNKKKTWGVYKCYYFDSVYDKKALYIPGSPASKCISRKKSKSYPSLCQSPNGNRNH